MQTGYSEEVMLEHLATLSRELGRFPTSPDIKMKRHADSTFPDAKTFQRLGLKAQLASKLAAYCAARPGYEDIASLCAGFAHDDSRIPEPDAAPLLGYVYLLKSGRFHKIGKSNSVGRRKRELAIQLLERAGLVHAIKTDDPDGIERYWHGRFQERRKNGEWFELRVPDIAAFRRRKFM